MTPGRLRVGIDAGGTFTDAVLHDPERGVLAAAKARTRADLSIGVAEAIDRVLGADVGDGRTGSTAGPVSPRSVSLVSLSTTLATNALVEGVGRPVALVFIGFAETELDRGGLRRALGGGPVILVDGGHEHDGTERHPLDVAAVVGAASGLEVEAFAVTARFGVRNPAHELAVRDALAPLGKPVACGHELSSELDGPRRALTCVLNAGLTGMVTDLCRAARQVLDERGIDAPLMIVKGDGSLVDVEVAVERPIETILSGPAASLIGAAHLLGSGRPYGPPDLVVADIGGTTTDVGIIRDGHPTLSRRGATVGGHRTMVEAVEMFTTGLGGDSEVRVDARSAPARLEVGPRRLVPLARLAIDEPDLVIDTLRSRQAPYRHGDTTFARAVDRAGRPAGALDQRADRILDGLAGWTPLDEVATTNLERSTVRSLVGRGLVELAGFTPTDASHVLGLQDDGVGEASRLAADLVAGASDHGGRPVRPDGAALSRWVVDTVVRRSAEAILEATLARDGLPEGTVDSPLVRQALDQRAEIDLTREGGPGPTPTTLISLGPSAPLVGLGAGAATYHPGAADLLGAKHLIPDHAGVANAVGAAVSSIRVTERATITQPTRGQFRIHLPDAGPDTGDIEPAVERATELLGQRVRHRAERTGAASVVLDVDVERVTAEVGGRTLLVEARVTVTGTGPPREAGDRGRGRHGRGG
jgi:N-methylhydantoinase A/oxoprolinase/acetone carboxylase beta subunit